jgi:hypothetical protein
MTLEEAREKEKELGITIYKAIQQFEEDTDCSVKNISLDHTIYYRIFKMQTKVSGLNLEVEL